MSLAAKQGRLRRGNRVRDCRQLWVSIGCAFLRSSLLPFVPPPPSFDERVNLKQLGHAFVFRRRLIAVLIPLRSPGCISPRN